MIEVNNDWAGVVLILGILLFTGVMIYLWKNNWHFR